MVNGKSEDGAQGQGTGSWKICKNVLYSVEMKGDKIKSKLDVVETDFIQNWFTKYVLTSIRSLSISASSGGCVVEELPYDS